MLLTHCTPGHNQELNPRPALWYFGTETCHRVLGIQALISLNLLHLPMIYLRFAKQTRAEKTGQTDFPSLVEALEVLMMMKIMMTTMKTTTTATIERIKVLKIMMMTLV